MPQVRHFEDFESLTDACLQQSLSFLSFSACELLAEIHRSEFQDVRQAVSWHFIGSGPLAAVLISHDAVRIVAHQLLNHPETPPEVIGTIIKHELLHVRFPSRVVGGRLVQHSIEFQQAEVAICHELDEAWSWLWLNFSECLRLRPHLGRVDVVKNWKAACNARRYRFETCRKLVAFQRGSSLSTIRSEIGPSASRPRARLDAVRRGASTLMELRAEWIAQSSAIRTCLR